METKIFAVCAILLFIETCVSVDVVYTERYNSAVEGPVKDDKSDTTNYMTEYITNEEKDEVLPIATRIQMAAPIVNHHPGQKHPGSITVVQSQIPNTMSNYPIMYQPIGLQKEPANVPDNLNQERKIINRKLAPTIHAYVVGEKNNNIHPINRNGYYYEEVGPLVHTSNKGPTIQVMRERNNINVLDERSTDSNKEDVVDNELTENKRINKVEKELNISNRAGGEQKQNDITRVALLDLKEASNGITQLPITSKNNILPSNVTMDPKEGPETMTTNRITDKNSRILMNTSKDILGKEDINDNQHMTKIEITIPGSGKPNQDTIINIKTNKEILLSKDMSETVRPDLISPRPQSRHYNNSPQVANKIYEQNSQHLFNRVL